MEQEEAILQHVTTPEDLPTADAAPSYSDLQARMDKFMDLFKEHKKAAYEARKARR
jgi:hypothetical protein